MGDLAQILHGEIIALILHLLAQLHMHIYHSERTQGIAAISKPRHGFSYRLHKLPARNAPSSPPRAPACCIQNVPQSHPTFRLARNANQHEKSLNLTKETPRRRPHAQESHTTTSTPSLQQTHHTRTRRHHSLRRQGPLAGNFQIHHRTIHRLRQHRISLPRMLRAMQLYHPLRTQTTSGTAAEERRARRCW